MKIDGAQVAKHLWETKYAAIEAEALAEENERRTDDMCDLPRVVSDFSLRPITIYDYFMFEGLEHPIAGSESAALAMSPHSLASVIWMLWSEKPKAPGRLCYFKFKLSLLLRWGNPKYPNNQYFKDLAAIVDYFNRSMIDSEAPKKEGERKSEATIGTHWLASVVVRIASHTGWSQAEIYALPIGRAFQYLRCIRSDEGGKPFVSSRVARIRTDFLAEAHRIINTGRMP